MWSFENAAAYWQKPEPKIPPRTANGVRGALVLAIARRVLRKAASAHPGEVESLR
jgi:hypothetical protein